MTPLPPGGRRPLPRRPHPERSASHPAGPGSPAERALQRRLGTTARADRFYDDQVLDHLNPDMRDFVCRQRMFFLATADAAGACDNTLRAGPPGLVEVLDERTLAWPEYKGNGVLASLANIMENPQVGMLMVDFVHDGVGLHVNGTARLVEPAAAALAGLEADAPAGRTASAWVVVRVTEAYIHCSKHIPRLAEVPAAEATSARRVRTADYFGTVAARRRDDAAS